MRIKKDDEIIRKGYFSYPKVFEPGNQLIEVVNKLQTLPIAMTNLTIARMSLFNALYDVKVFLNHYYKLHKIPFLFQLKRDNKYSAILFKMHPYHLPLFSFDNNEVFNGAVIETFVNSSKYNISFRGIELNRIITECTSATYVHEITHTQVDSIIGIVQDYYHSEILSIFNELFHYLLLGDDERLLKTFDCRRIRELDMFFDDLIVYQTDKSIINRENLLEDSKYVISILKAYNLFITFYYANENIKNEILDDIQCIFDGYLTLEEMLFKYEVTL